MKKVLFPILALVLVLGLTLPVAAHTEDDPDVTQLIAGQHTDVGEVQVWNDGTNLHVTYVITDLDWVITETHLYVGQNIPGTTAPGQFPYDDDNADSVTDTMVEYVIPLADIDSYSMQLNKKGNETGKMVADDEAGVQPCEDVIIAAHAVVVKPADDCWEPVWQIGDVETVGCPTETPVLLTNYADEFNWANATICGAGDRLVDDQPVYDNPFVVGTTATSAFPYASNYKYSYATNIDVEWDGALTFGGKLTISWTPGASGSETKEVSGDGITTATFNADGSPAPGQGWFLDKFALVENTVDVDPLTSGTHTITFKDTNEEGDGAIWDWIRLEKPCEEDETAWGAGVDFPGRNWATYFRYHIQEPCVSGSVVNGGFELPDVAGRWYAYSSGTTDLEWTVEWHDGATTFETHTRPEFAMLEVHNSIWTPHEGDQYVEMDTDWSTDPGSNTFSGEPASVSISQHIATCPGETYTLEYAWSPRPGHSDNSIEVWWGGSLLTTHTADGSSNTDTSWTPTIHTGLSPTGTSTEIKFIEVGTADSFGMLLDAVSLVEE